jgi:outer membrane lipoprotein carrier protein
MKLIQLMMICLILTFAGPGFVRGAEMPTPSAPSEDTPDLDTILDNLESTYLFAGFGAVFVQTSTIKAMDISDTATGKIFVKPPGMMRWEYETPDPQLIVSDGEQLWVYRPEDKQVMVGKSPTFFGDGKGAGFLSDIRQIREQFDISLEVPENPDEYMLKAIPHKNSLDLSLIYLFVSKSDSHLTRIITRNTYDDETRMDFTDILFDLEMSADMFTFIISEGMDILKIDE